MWIESKIWAKGWQKYTTVDFYFIPLFIREPFKEKGNTFTLAGNFHILFSLHKLEIHELRLPFSIINTAEDTLEMFIDAFQVSLRWLSVRAGMYFEYPSWRLGMGKELDIFALSSASLNHLFLTAFRKVLPPLFLEGTL